MRFEWDENKNAANVRKHGLTFQLATRVFADPLRITEWDQDVDDEERWKTFGLVSDVLLVVVVHTIQEMDGTTVMRLISARKASNSERRLYEEENG